MLFRSKVKLGVRRAVHEVLLAAENGYTVAGMISLVVFIVIVALVRTTHTITGSIMVVGSRRRFSAVRWGMAGRIVWAPWIFTIPASALVAAASWFVLCLFQL